MSKEDETKEMPLEDRAKTGFKQDYDPATCRKKKAGGYYLCKESERALICSRALSILGKYYCPREVEK